MIDEYRKMSNCCGGYILGDGDEGLCSICKEGCVSIEKEEQEEKEKAVDLRNRSKSINKGHHR